MSDEPGHDGRAAFAILSRRGPERAWLFQEEHLESLRLDGADWVSVATDRSLRVRPVPGGLLFGSKRYSTLPALGPFVRALRPGTRLAMTGQATPEGEFQGIELRDGFVGVYRDKKGCSADLVSPYPPRPEVLRDGRYRAAFVVSARLGDEAARAICSGAPVESAQPLRLDVDPLGALVIDDQERAVAIYAVGYMFEAFFSTSELSSSEMPKVLQLASRALGVRPGESAE